MTVVRIGAIRRYTALSVDSKPVTSVPEGATIYETDTHRNYTFDGVRWWMDAEPLDNTAIVAALQEQLVLLRGIRLGLMALTGTDLTDTETT